MSTIDVLCVRSDYDENYVVIGKVYTVTYENTKRGYNGYDMYDGYVNDCTHSVTSSRKNDKSPAVEHEVYTQGKFLIAPSTFSRLDKSVVVFVIISSDIFNEEDIFMSKMSGCSLPVETVDKLIEEAHKI